MIRAAAVLLVLCGALAALPATAQETGPGAAGDLAALRQAARAGDAGAQYELGTRLHEGSGVVQNFARAADWFTRAARAGDARAQNRLGRYFHAGLAGERDQAAAIRWLSAAAETGEPDYLFDLARALEQGADGSSDPGAAAPLYARAAEAGHVEAAVSLGVLYQNGAGVAQDFDRARALYETAARAGNPRAQNNLGLLYVRGSGVAQDYTRAAGLFAAAAEQGLKQAMTNLAVMYENGFGVKLDEALATRWYRRAGQEGGAAAPGATALIYDPRLAPPDPAQGARAGLERAAGAGDPVAQFQLAWLMLEGAGPADFATARIAAQLFAGAAARGHAAAMANLGLMYMDGHGLRQDYVLAQMWLILAATAGLDEAATRSAALRGRMTPDQIARAQARAETYWQARTGSAPPAPATEKP